ncbi:PQQ-binding-like beta-propeller repeat protein [Opitutales bacterium]|jgi:outer membrane protein assembly factor BamB|nr:PQQ-binding-like beta-propeller repeat protein [Opitutales bacterium]
MCKPAQFVFLFLIAQTLLLSSEGWEQWRGPNGNGHAPAGEYPLEWSENKNLSWKTLLPGRGHSSPVYQDSTAWITTALETVASQEERERRANESSFPGAMGLHYLSKVEFIALQVDLKTGKIIRQIKVFEKKAPQAIHRLNSYASPSPVLKNGKLFIHFGAFGNACLNSKTGQIIWKNQDPDLWIHHENGPGSTPVLWNKLMIFHLDGTDKQSVVALFQETGKIAWHRKRSGKLRENPQTKKAYATPLIVQGSNGPVLISTGADWVYGYHPETGKELWKINYGILGFSNVSKPLKFENLFIVSTGFMKGEIHAYQMHGNHPPSLAWKMTKGAPKKPSPIIVNGLLYVINDGGILTCLNARDGEVLWRSRLEGEYSSSPTFADGKIYISNHSGKTTVIQPGTSMKILAENQLDDGHMASFVPLRGSFLVRTEKALYRIATGLP